ncbi:MAG: universal stress protein [Methanoregula sp.]
MFEKVLFPTDFSESAQWMLSCVTGIPGVKEVVLLHIIDATGYSVHGWTHGPELENARLLMEEKKTFLEERGLTAVIHVDVITSGTIPQRILKIAELEKVSLILMGTHQKSTFNTLVHGSVSYDLLHHMNTHVLIMQQDIPVATSGKTVEETCPRIFSKVLVPLDFTKNSYELLPFIREMHDIGELVLEHVVTEGNSNQEIERNVLHAREELGKIQTDMEHAGFRVTVHIRVGDPADKIVSLSEEETVSLILMYAHKRNWIEKFLQGSMPFSVVKTAKKPVLVLQPE